MQTAGKAGYAERAALVDTRAAADGQEHSIIAAFPGVVAVKEARPSNKAGLL